MVILQLPPGSHCIEIADKCFTIRITNSRNPIRVDYKIHDQHLNLVPDSKYLGVSLDQTLSWKTHINNVTVKAYRTLGFLRRNMTGCTKIVKDRKKTQNLSHQLEYVQHRAARYVCSDFHSRTPGCVTDMLRSLEWESLQTRRKYARLILFYKISNNLIDSILQNLTAVQEVNTNMFSHMRTKTFISSLSSQDQSLTGITCQQALPLSINYRNSALNISTGPLYRRTFQTAGPVRTTTLYLPLARQDHRVKCRASRLKITVARSSSNRAYVFRANIIAPAPTEAFLERLISRLIMASFGPLAPMTVARRRRPPHISTIYGFKRSHI